MGSDKSQQEEELLFHALVGAKIALEEQADLLKQGLVTEASREARKAAKVADKVLREYTDG